MSSAALNPQCNASRRSLQHLPSWQFWLPTCLILLAVVIPDFETINVHQAAGVYLESDLIATMATENSLRENLFLFNLLALGGFGGWLFLFGSSSPLRASSATVTLPASPVVRRRPRPILLGLMVVQMLIAIASLGWSVDVELTFRRLVITGLFVLGCWGIGKTWDGLDLVRMVLYLSALFAISGILAEIYYGSFLAPINYRFSGYLHPNRQALSCGLFVLAALTMKSLTGKRWYWLAASVAYGLLLLTGSRGGALAGAVAAVFYLVMVTPVQRRIIWFLLAGLCLGGGTLFMALEPYSGSRLEALAKLGRNDPQADPKSLTGRLPIWTQIVNDIQDRPALGYGYAAYWTAERIHRLSYIHDWEFSNAHSSYLETILAVGLIGFALGLLAVLAVFARGMWLYAKHLDLGLLFIVSVFVMAFVSGLIESTFVSVGYEYVVWLAGAFVIVYYPSQPGRYSLTQGAAP